MSLSTYFYDALHEPFFTPSDFSRFFDAAWDARTPSSHRDRQDPSPAAARDVAPRMDIHECKDKNEMTVTMELPGMRKEDVSLDVHNNRLIVSGQSALSTELDHEGYVVRERRVGRFSRVLPLPAGMKPEDIKASMDDGILTVRFPKTHPEQEPKKITIT